MTPIGYTQSNGTYPLRSPVPLAFSLIGEPLPSTRFQRVLKMKNAMFPQNGPLRTTIGQ